jgi:hypothetical protein
LIGSRRDDLIASADGQRQGLLTERVQPQIEHGRGDPVVGPGLDRAGRGLQALGLTCHLAQVGEDGRPLAEEFPRLIGQRGRVPFAEIADRDQLDGVVVGPRQLRQPRQVPPPHPTAAHDRQPDSFRHELSSPVRGVGECASYAVGMNTTARLDGQHHV